MDGSLIPHNPPIFKTLKPVRNPPMPPSPSQHVHGSHPRHSPPPTPAPPAALSTGPILATYLPPIYPLPPPSRMSTEAIYATFQGTVDDCRAHGTKARLSSVVEVQLRKHMPEDAHVLCSGHTWLGVTMLSSGQKRVSEFASREDLIEALLTSCHIPGYSTGTMTTKFRGRR